VIVEQTCTLQQWFNCSILIPHSLMVSHMAYTALSFIWSRLTAPMGYQARQYECEHGMD